MTGNITRFCNSSFVICDHFKRLKSSFQRISKFLSYFIIFIFQVPSDWSKENFWKSRSASGLIALSLRRKKSDFASLRAILNNESALLKIAKFYGWRFFMQRRRSNLFCLTRVDIPGFKSCATAEWIPLAVDAAAADWIFSARSLTAASISRGQLRSADLSFSIRIVRWSLKDQ